MFFRNNKVVIVIMLILIISGVQAQDNDILIADAIEGYSLSNEIPNEFSESPLFTTMVQNNELPPVEERLPLQPMVIQPLEEIGTYGGVWHRAFTGAGDGENGNRINAYDKLLFWDVSGTEIAPAIVRQWEVSEDGTSTCIFLREGHRWSDGEPFTTDDFVFWFDELYSNPAIANPINEMAVNGQPGWVEKVDSTTVCFVFSEPNFLFIDLLAGDTLIGGGQSVRQARGSTFGGYAPAHYLRQFLPVDESQQAIDEANSRAQEAGFEDWVAYLHYLKDWQLNVELPVLGSYHTVQPITESTWIIERNPYFYAVDTAGNQLPYIDRVEFVLESNLELLNLRAISGEFDLQARHIGLNNLDFLVSNQSSGNYTVHLDPAFHGSDAALYPNLSYQNDSYIGDMLRTADFRRALSLGIIRIQLNFEFWLGLGIPGSVAPFEGVPQSPGPEYRDLWSTFDAAQANSLLDNLGLTEFDDEGYRLRTDNGERLELEIIAIPAFLPYDSIASSIADHWRSIGIFARVNVIERSEALDYIDNNLHHLVLWSNGGSESLYLFPRQVLPVDSTWAFMGPAYARWFTGAPNGIAPEDPELLRALELFTSANSLSSELRDENAREIWRILVNEQFIIGTVGQSPADKGVRIVSNNLGNVPDRACIAQHCRTPAMIGITMYFRDS